MAEDNITGVHLTISDLKVSLIAKYPQSTVKELCVL